MQRPILQGFIKSSINWNFLFPIKLIYWDLPNRQTTILMSLLYHNDTIIKKEKELLRALLIQFCKLEVTAPFSITMMK